MAAVTCRSAPHPFARRQACASNLKQIGMALWLYAADHGEMFPPHLGVLYDKYAAEADAFICPSTSAHPDPNQERSALEARPPVYAKFAPEHISYYSYYYVTGRRPDDPPESIIAFENAANHDGNGLHVLRADGRAEWMKPTEARKEIAERLSRAAQEERRLEIVRC